MDLVCGFVGLWIWFVGLGPRSLGGLPGGGFLGSPGSRSASHSANRRLATIHPRLVGVKAALVRGVAGRGVVGVVWSPGVVWAAGRVERHTPPDLSLT